MLCSSLPRRSLGTSGRHSGDGILDASLAAQHGNCRQTRQVGENSVALGSDHSTVVASPLFQCTLDTSMVEFSSSLLGRIRPIGHGESRVPDQPVLRQGLNSDTDGKTCEGCPDRKAVRPGKFDASAIAAECWSGLLSLKTSPCFIAAVARVQTFSWTSRPTP